MLRPILSRVINVLGICVIAAAIIYGRGALETWSKRAEEDAIKQAIQERLSDKQTINAAAEQAIKSDPHLLTADAAKPPTTEK